MGEDKQLIIRFAKQGDILGHRGLGGDETYPVTATALEDSKACFIENNFLETILQTNNGFTHKLMQLYAVELQKAEKRMRNLAHMEVKGRIAETLIELKQTFGSNKDGNIAMTISRQDIAAYAGTTYETVFKLFNEFVAQKIIRTSGKDIAILKETNLNGFINE